ncbi:MAG: GNAT family N-acetyltransferase [Parvibaculaceae bacterium]
MPSPDSLALFDADDIARHIEELSELVHACVHDGASIGFVMPHARADSMAFWRDRVSPALRGGGRLLLVAWRDGRIAGSVQLDYDTPANQPHRAEIRKLLVHPDFRRQGIARRLMAEIERHAARLRRNLITLDTRTGDSAEPLYRSLGYQTTGIIPGYCRDTFSERLDATTIMYKNL